MNEEKYVFDRNKKVNPNAPHQAIISLVVEVLERMEDGSVIGPPTERFGKVYTVVGKNLEECKQELNRFMEKLK